MLQWKDVFKDTYQFSLISATYEAKARAKNPADVNIEDSIETKTFSDHMILTYSRQVRLESESSYSIQVSFSARLSYANETLPDKLESDRDALMHFILENGGTILNNLSARMSMVIMQLTSASGRPPLIIAPLEPDKYGKIEFKESV